MTVVDPAYSQAEGPSEIARQDQGWSWTALSLLAVFWSLLTLVVLLTGLFQPAFFNPEIVQPFLRTVIFGELAASVLLMGYQTLKDRKEAWWGLFLLNGFLITALMVSVPWNQSVFFMMYLVNIVAAGLTLQSRGSTLIGLVSLIGFDFAVLVSPQEKLFGYLYTFFVNNGALILVAYLSGRLSNYLEALGVRIDTAVRDFKKIKNLHELILGSIPSGVLTVDQEGQLIHGNRMAREILSESSLANPETWESLRGELRRVSSALAPPREFFWETGTKQKKVIRCQKARLVLEDFSDAADVFVLEDVTELRTLEEGLRNQEKLAAVGKLAAGIAHEIRNPLASISGSVQMLSAQAGNEEDRKLFNIVIRETDRLNLLISEFLDYAKPLPKPTERISLTSLMKEVLELVSYNKTLRADVHQERLMEGEAFILGFKDKLKQALLNIVINAYQAMEKSETAVLRIQLVRSEGKVVLQIGDSGAGMSEETRRRIFEPFYTTKARGTGLGLAVTHKILEGHGASVLVESEPGKGTEFVIKMNEAVILTQVNT